MKNYKKEHVRHLQVYKQFDKRQYKCVLRTQNVECLPGTSKAGMFLAFH